MSSDPAANDGVLSGGEAPPGWPMAVTPRRIALLGWARLSSQAWEGSGYNLVASELARGLAMSGHEVSYLASGMRYRLFRKPSIEPLEEWGGVRCYDLVNSPNLSPAALNFKNMQREMHSPDQAALILGWLDEIGAEVVHIHSVEGYGLDVIAAIEASGRPVVVTPHNYWFVCPQVDLLHQETRVCQDYEGGRRCVDCVPATDAGERIRKKKVGQSLEQLMGLKTANSIRGTIYGVPGLVRRLLKPSGWMARGGWKPPVLNPDRLIDPEAGRGFEGVGPDDRRDAGVIEHDFSFSPIEPAGAYESAPIDQNERFLAGDKHLVVLNDYGKRRVAGVGSLNNASMVTPPSDFLRKVHVGMGVDEARTRWVRLGLPHFDQLNRRARRSPYYGERPWDPATSTRPLRFGFLGTTRSNKGLQVLADAIPLLDREVRQRATFMIRAQGNDWEFRKRLAKFPEVSVWGAFDRFQLISAAGEYDVAIIPHIWFENSPLVLLENLHAGKFVITSRLGGPVDWIEPPNNGLFFPAGEPEQLAQRIASLVTGEVAVPSAREIHAATTLVSYPDYVRASEATYADVLGDQGGDGDGGVVVRGREESRVG